MKRVLTIVLTVVLVFSLVACGGKSDPEKLGVRGEITSLSQGQDNKVTSILVEGALESDTAYDKASVAITSKTRIIEKDTKKKLSADDLKAGMQVEVVFEGPVAESYPVQASAKEVRVLAE